MKTFSHPFVWRTWVLTMFCVGFLWPSTAPAQPTASTVDSRFLLIFDTSSAMKSRVPRVNYALERLFFSMMNGQLHTQDDIGVWTFDRELRTGDLSLQSWIPQDAAAIASNITHFVSHQHYSKSARFDVVLPAVNNLVRNSQRLTVLIFCDGTEEIKGTPYDDAINSAFKQNERALRKAGETFIIVLRAQSGQYTGYSVNSSIVGVNFPEFPPLPAPPQAITQPQINQAPKPAPVSAPPPARVIQLPPLVIIGTNVGANPVRPASSEVALSNSPPAKVKPGPPPAGPLSGSTNASLTNAAPSKTAGAPTNLVAPTSENAGLSRHSVVVTGGVLLIAAMLVIILALIRSPRPGGGSLITRSMNKK